MERHLSLKCFFFVVSFILTFSSILYAKGDADSSEYLFPSFSKYVAGFGYGPLVKFSRVGDKFLGGGGGGGGIVFFRRVILAYYGHGTNDHLKLENDTKLYFNQNIGVLTGYRFFFKKKYHPLFCFLYGIGSFRFINADDEIIKELSFQMIEPMLTCEINLSKGMTFVTGVGYKITFGNESYLGYTNKDTNGLSLFLTLFFGNL